MAGTMQFDLVSPERRLASLVASEVMIPGAEGDMTAMEGHAPTITALRTGPLRAIDTAGAVKSYVVTGGFAEITGTSVTVLAERAIPFDEVTDAVIDAILSEARSLAMAALPEDKDRAERNLSDAQALHDAYLARH
jgi:F-type H+-transporting ATPase subunit epsilon